MKFRLALAAATCLALPLAAHAQPVTGPYVSLLGGTSILNPTNYNYNATDFGGKVLYKEDYAGAGGIGYGFGDGFRVELGGDFIRNTAHKFDANDGSSGRLSGAEQKYGPMLNIYYDIPVGLPIFPYVGAGAGYQWVKFDSDIKDDFGSAIGGTKGSFAYDVIGGVSYPLAMVPGLSLIAEYRFMQLTSSRNYSGSSFGIPVGSVKIGQESSHTFLAGVRYQIFPPPVMAPAPAPMAAPMAAPAPAPAKTYLVFFDWDKYSLTPKATQIIAQAASDSKTTGTTTIAVSGYTDTSGTAVYNQGLSVRRAKAVAAQLVADGVPASEIVAKGFGDTHLLVPTGPGVREPQNRRVEIVLQ
jgi:outer membrane protein OmpA-like peptidoglycan-associated protein/outer membrane protein W